ncbi:heme o synthase [Pyrofollis japonicus]|nr:heme o synthase [Pyrofollis japonicus]
MNKIGRAASTSLMHVIGELTKFKQTMLLLFSMYTAFIAGGGLHKPIETHLWLWIIGYMAIGSTTAVNMYFDRDIDALMARTNKRPLPSGLVKPRSVLYLSISLFIISLVLGALLVNVYYSLAIFVGFFFDIIAYTLLLKRRTPLSIIMGAVAGGAPALGGWAAATSSITAPAVLFSLLVAAWVPSHIWFLASYYREDYAAANVPMLPVVADATAVGTGIGLGALVLAHVIIALWLLGAVGVASLAYGLLASSHIFSLAVEYVDKKGDKETSFKAFKMVNMHLGMLFLVIILEKALMALS